MNTEDKIRNIIEDSIKTKTDLLLSTYLKKIEEIVTACVDSIKNGNTIYFCGNGGSAADAQHLAAELSGRFYHDRDPYPAEALHVNTSYLTAVANDYGYDHIYSRLIKGIGKSGDVLFGLSTSGKSKNIINAIYQANRLGLRTIGMTGNETSKLNDYCSITINVPSNDTPRIQEAHMLIGHIVCQLVEERLMDAK